MKPAVERALLVIVPFVTLLTFGLGLHVGSGSRALGAKVSAGALGLGRPGLSLQISTLFEDRRLRELAPLQTIDIEASHRGDRASWHGATNDEGIAEAWLDLPDVREGDHVSLSISGQGGQNLAEGLFVVPASPASAPHGGGELRATRKSGHPNLEVFVRDGHLVPGEVQTVFVHAGDAKTNEPSPGTALEALAEPGLEVVTPFPKTSASGWAEARVRADFLTAEWTLHAPLAPADPDLGVWSGALPVSPGAASITLPTTLPESTPYALDFEVPPASPRLYVEVDDARGRDFAAALTATIENAHGHVHVDLPPLTRGLYWLVSSPEAHGAETMKGATMARPFYVGDHAPSRDEPEGATLARQAFPLRERPLVLDGLVPKRNASDARRRKGLRIAVGSLAIAAWLETLLILRAAKRSRISLAKFAEAAHEAGGVTLEASARAPFTSTVVILVLATLLGIVFLAALLVVR